MYLLTTETFQRFGKHSVLGKRDKPVLLILSLYVWYPLEITELDIFSG
jgi:hypothetical protein